MAQQIINIGTTANDHTGDTLRSGGSKINANFTELYSSLAGLLELKGNTDCSANPNYPAASTGDAYYVTVAGKIGGASGKAVDVGDVYIAKADNAGGTEASVGASWFVLEHNLEAMLPLTGGTLTGPLQVPDDAYDATGWNGNNEVPTKNAVRDKIEAVIAGGGYTDEQVRDVIGAALVAGTNVTITVNDAGDTITIASTGGGYTDEQVRDVIGAALVAGSGISITVNDAGDTITIAASGASGNSWSKEWGPLVNEAPSANFATLNARNGHAVLEFDASTAESAIFTGVLPNDYSGAGITAAIYWAGATATSGNVMWQVAIERIDAGGQDTDSDGFASAQAFAAAAANASSGVITKSTLNISNGANMDSLAAGDLFRLKVTRDASNASDTMTGDAQLFRVMLVSQ